MDDITRISYRELMSRIDKLNKSVADASITGYLKLLNAERIRRFEQPRCWTYSSK